MNSRKTDPSPYFMFVNISTHTKRIKIAIYSAPQQLYADLIPLPKLKYEQLQFLKKFVDESLQDYYTNLPCASNNAHLNDADMVSNIN